MEKNKIQNFKVVKQKPKVYKTTGGGLTKVRPLTKYAIVKGSVPVLLIPDYFPPEIAKGIGESVIAAWGKANILPIIKV